MKVPVFRPSITDDEINEVVDCLRSGWLTTGPRVRTFETAFADYVGARHAIALNSGTAALHLALDAIGLRRGDCVVVPAFTFAATAEVVRYFDAVPVMVDSEPRTLNVDMGAARATIEALRRGEPVAGLRPPYGPVRAFIPVHFAGQMVDVERARAIGDEFEISIIEDAAHTLPARWKDRAVGSTADITCFSFYANKCITTGEGGMLTTDDDAVAERVRCMALHGLSTDAWKRHMTGGRWYYEIVAPGFKYNMTDVAAALGIHQLARADDMRARRARLADRYAAQLADFPLLELPAQVPETEHAWHVYPVRMTHGAWAIGRDRLIEELNARDIGIAVQWMPLHMHPYYRREYGYGEGLFPVAEDAWPRILSLPLFPDMTDEEQDAVIDALRDIARTFAG